MTAACFLADFGAAPLLSISYICMFCKGLYRAGRYLTANLRGWFMRKNSAERTLTLDFCREAE